MGTHHNNPEDSLLQNKERKKIKKTSAAVFTDKHIIKHILHEYVKNTTVAECPGVVVKTTAAYSACLISKSRSRR